MNQHSRKIVSPLTEQYRNVITGYETWLNEQSSQHLPAWRSRLNCSSESAIAEACVHELLSPLVTKIEIHEIPSVGGFDFTCTVKCDPTVSFYVEVVTLETDSISNKTSLPDDINEWEGGGVGSVLRDFWSRRRRKQDQASKEILDKPLVLTFTAFHQTATFVHFNQSGAESLLRPPTQCCIPIDPNPDDSWPASWEEPILDHSLFFQKVSKSNAYTAACPEISAILLFGIPWRESGGRKPCAYLALNPTATHDFDPKWLTTIQCCHLKENWEKTNPCDLEVEWAGTET